MLRWLGAPLLAVVMMVPGCSFEDRTDGDDRAAADTAARAQPRRPDLLLEVDIASRAVNVYRGGRVVATHPAAVGSDEWPTPTGEWDIGQVIFNPRWVPPEEAWAEEEEIAEPGDPENPLGKAQLVYRAPNSIHGTNAPESLGQAVSHGSVRVSDEVAVELARMVMEAGGATTPDSVVQAALADSTRRVDIAIPNPVPIRVVAGPVAATATADTAAPEPATAN